MINNDALVRPHTGRRLSYAEREALSTHPLAKRLLQIMLNKQSNLAVSADLPRAADILALANTIGPTICMLKTHIDIIEDFTPAFTKQLRQLADHHHFLIFEDRKFADIGHTVQLQYQKGIYQIAEWADIINAHSLPGAGIIEGLRQIGLPKGRGLLLLAEMSSSGHLFTADYMRKTVEMAEAYPEFVMGFISQHAVSPNPNMLHITPGVQMLATGDALGQRYRTPEQAIIEQGCDVIIVGRGIIKATDPAATAEQYRRAGWRAYTHNIE